MSTQQGQSTKLEDSCTCMPIFTIANLTNYFVTRITSDGKPANDFKNVNSRAYPLFNAGHIQSIFITCKDTSHDIRCICLPEMKKDTLYKISLTLDSAAGITQATCACPAGSGPFGSCKHISALCYALEEFSRIKQLRSPDSCTSRLQKWNQPRKRKLEPCNVDDITFVKPEFGKSKKQMRYVPYDPRPTELSSTSDADISSLREKLSKIEKDIALLHVLPCSLPETPPLAPSLPLTPPLLRDRVQHELAMQPQPVSCKSIGVSAMDF